MLLRDGAAGLEVLLLRRHQRSDVLGGVYVFPGGKLDEADRVAARARFGGDDGLHRGFGEGVSPLEAATLYVAAMRELAEECGVRLGDMSNIHPHSRWITPAQAGISKRFDTWFFVALLPRGAVPRHDGHELVDSVWLTPRDALTRYWNGKLPLAPPQIMSLVALSRHETARAALEAARTAIPGRVQPERVAGDDPIVIAFPGDPQHPVDHAVIPGPSRLILRGDRFEPMHGFEALFG